MEQRQQHTTRKQQKQTPQRSKQQYKGILTSTTITMEIGKKSAQQLMVAFDAFDFNSPFSGSNVDPNAMMQTLFSLSIQKKLKLIHPENPMKSNHQDEVIGGHIGDDSSALPYYEDSGYDYTKPRWIFTSEYIASIFVKALMILEVDEVVAFLRRHLHHPQEAALVGKLFQSLFICQITHPQHPYQQLRGRWLSSTKKGKGLTVTLYPKNAIETIDEDKLLPERPIQELTSAIFVPFVPEEHPTYDFYLVAKILTDGEYESEEEIVLLGVQMAKASSHLISLTGLLKFAKYCDHTAIENRYTAIFVEKDAADQFLTPQTLTKTKDQFGLLVPNIAQLVVSIDSSSLFFSRSPPSTVASSSASLKTAAVLPPGDDENTSSGTEKFPNS